MVNLEKNWWDRIKSWIRDDFITILTIFMIILCLMLVYKLILDVKDENVNMKTYPIEEVVLGEEYICPYCHIKTKYIETLSPKVTKVTENQVLVKFRCHHCRQKIACINNL